MPYALETAVRQMESEGSQAIRTATKAGRHSDATAAATLIHTDPLSKGMER